MKRLWNALSFVAVVNLLALAGFAGWLWQSDRLDQDRLLRIREMFATTLTDEVSAAQVVSGEEAAAREQVQEGAERANPPRPSAEQVVLTAGQEEQAGAAVRRLQDETAHLLAQLEERGAQLDRREAAFRAERQAWLDGIRGQQETRESEQFAKTVRQYESAPPKIAKQWVLELVQQGQKTQVVAYLDAMSPRAASKILRELKSEEDARLATELLEELRGFGLVTEDAEVPSDDDSSRAAG